MSGFDNSGQPNENQPGLNPSNSSTPVSSSHQNPNPITTQGANNLLANNLLNPYTAASSSQLPSLANPTGMYGSFGGIGQQQQAAAPHHIHHHAAMLAATNPAHNPFGQQGLTREQLAKFATQDYTEGSTRRGSLHK